MQGCQKTEEEKSKMKNQKSITGNGKSENRKNRIRKTEPEKSGFEKMDPKKMDPKKERTEKRILKTELNPEHGKYRKLPDKVNEEKHA